MHVRCPHCRNAIEIVGDSDLSEVDCPSCGSSFNLVPETQSYTPKLRTIGHFQLLEQLGMGSFGSVWKARDTQLDRLVAVKIPRRDQIAPENAEMFLREARAAAQLKHPQIVAVHEVGRDNDTLYIVSDFIQGATLADRLTAGPMTPREAAELCAQIGDALHHAHEAGVIHRDLKPSNVMLDADGRPHIMDFGLAKREAGEITMTVEGKVLGTAAYMSPEQARGEGHSVDRRTDVYSLGVILFELLTGELPFRGNVRMLLHQVINDDAPSPRKLDSRVPRDLETICLKCLDKDPRRRYTSAADVSGELRRFLANQPILARPVGIFERGWRWSRRNSMVAALLATSAALLLAVAVVSTLAYMRAARDATAKTRLAEEQTQLATKNAKLARTERLARAEADQSAAVPRQQSQLALKSLESVIFDIERKLENVPGAGELRRSLLETALARLQEVSDQFASRATIDRNTKVALDDLGVVFLRIGSISSLPTAGSESGGAGLAPDVDGPLTAARKVFQQAFDIARRLAAADPTNAQAQRDLSESYSKLGYVQALSGQATEALESCQQGLEIRLKLVAANPNDARAQRDLSIAYESLGDMQLESGLATEALGSYQKQLKISQKLAAADPTGAQAQRDLSFSYEKLGDLQLQSGQATEALASYLQCLELRQKLAAADPTGTRAQRDLYISYENLGDVQLQSGLATEALGWYRKQLEISQKLAAADPRDAEAQRGLSVAYERLGDVQLQSGQTTEAIAAYQHGLEIRQKSAAADRSDARAQIELYILLAKKGAANQTAMRFDEAISWYEKALNILQDLDQAKRLTPPQKPQIGVMQQRIEACQHARIALGDWQTLLDQPMAVLPALLEIRGTQFIQASRAGDAAQAVTKLRELGTATAGQLYNASCVYCLCAAGIKAENDELTAEQAAERQQHITDALAALREAIAAGWTDFAHMQKDSDLAVLRNLPEFQKLLPPKGN